jgi:hypothetical protein
MIMRGLGVSLLVLNVMELEYLLVVTSIGKVVRGNPRNLLVYVDAWHSQLRLLEEYCHWIGSRIVCFERVETLLQSSLHIL